MSRGPRAERRDWGGDDSGCHILHVDMDSFFAAVEILDRPELAGRPVVVAGSDRGVVTSATYEARACGVHAAMPAGRARRLCPAAVFLPPRYARYREVSREVMAVLESVTPVIEPLSIDEAFLDISGAVRRLGRPRGIGELVRRRISQEVGVVASVGIASTKHVAKIASQQAKPDGLLLVPAARTVPFLHSLPVAALWGVGERTRTVLAGKGVSTVAELAQTPLPTVERWLGRAHGARLHELACGHDERTVQARQRAKSVGSETTFAVDVVDRAELDRVLLRLAHGCAAKLRDEGLLAGGVAVKVRFPDFSTVSRARSLPAPTSLAHHITAVARELLGTVAVPPGGVRLLGVRAEALVDAGSVGLQDTVDGDATRHLAEAAMDEVRRRFGSGTVGPASLLTERSRGF